MNPHFAQLRGALRSEAGVSEEELIAALFLIRAHWNLAGIVACCRRLQHLIERFPVLGADPDDRAQLHVLKVIADLKDLDPHLLRVEGRVRKAKALPIWKYTGDSGLGDLLLIEPSALSSGEHSRDFDQILAWFAWQTFQHQKRTHRFSEYRAYIEGDGSVRLKEGGGNRIYAAFLALRDFADSGAGAHAREAVEALGALKEADSIRLALLLRIGHSKLTDRAAAARVRLKGAYGLDDSAIAVMAEAAARVLPETIERFLIRIWVPSLDQSSEGGGGGGAIGREIRRPDVEIYGQVAFATAPVDEEGLQSGVAVDVFDRRRDEEVDPQQEPDEGSGPEPEVTIYLADRGDPIKAWFASRSALHHIERQNAMLPWSHWRIGAQAIQRVWALAVLVPNESIAKRRARLGLLLSLLSGRPLDETVAVQVGDSPDLVYSDDKPMAISLQDLSLSVVAGTPSLKNVDPPEAYCFPWAMKLNLALPETCRPLIESLRGTSPRFSTEAVTCARALLKNLPAHLGITARGVSGALRLALMEAAAGDLGWVKVVTNASEPIFANLIHYASYEQVVVERQWRQIVEGWIGPLPDIRWKRTPGARVGTPYALDPERVAAAITRVKGRLRLAIQEKRWAAVANNLVLYTANWLALAKAGRATSRPVPGVIAPDGWALVQDKSRDDQSTDRYLPLSDGVIEQIRVLHAFQSAMSILDPDYKLPGQLESGRLDMAIYTSDLSVRAFKPSDNNAVKSLRSLPGNWARKLVRSEAGELAGRIKDGGLGHIVRGRHPWSLYSTLPSPAFREQWLKVQRRLEAELGFEVIAIDGLDHCTVALPCPMPERPRREVEKPAVETPIDESRAQALLQRADPDLYEAVFTAEPPPPESALALAKVAARRLVETSEPDLPRMLGAMCAHIRSKTSIQVFAAKPRRQFQKDWQVDEREFRLYAHVTSRILSRVEEDLARLKARPAPSVETDQIELGRFLMIAVWRLQLLCSSHLEKFLEYVAGPEPILAVGSLRVVELQVRCVRTGEPMLRTVMLDPYSATYTAVERTQLRRLLESRLDYEPDKRRHRWQAALRAYLANLGIPSSITLSEMMGAARQSLLLNASPILAAYASGEIVTTDLDDAELRRLAGLAPKRQGRKTVELPKYPVDQELAEESEHQAPDDVQAAASKFLKGFSNFRSPASAEWARRYSVHPNKSAIGKLLAAFARHQIETFRDTALAKRGDKDPKISGAMEFRIERSMRVIWQGLRAFSDADDQWRPIDEATAQRLVELTEPYFPRRIHREAWTRFQSFLADPETVMAGYSIGKFENFHPRDVSAKVLAVAEIRAIKKRLGSVRCGIGSADHRASAQRHFEIAAGTGTRRSEAEMLRTHEDSLDECLRIQEYDDHTLKTAAAVRQVPMNFPSPRLREIVAEARADGRTKLIDARPGRDAKGQNFFPAVSNAMKDVTGDQDLAPHHLRHTAASGGTLSMLAPAVKLALLEEDLPWVTPLVEHVGDRDALLGKEGQWGQGLQAVSGLLGHLHGSLTSRHYIHTFGIALYTYILGLKHGSLEIAFADRCGSRATLFGAVKVQCDALGHGHAPTLATRARIARNVLESRAEAIAIGIEEGSRGSASGQKSVLVHHDLRLGVRLEEGLTSTQAPPTSELSFDQIEKIDRFFAAGEGEAPEGAEHIRNALEVIASVRSGKRGVRGDKRRHPMPRRGIGDVPLPKMVDVDGGRKNAEILIDCMDRLKSADPETYRWLLHKWVNDTDAQQGLITLHRESDLKYLETLRQHAVPSIVYKTEVSKIATSRIRTGTEKGTLRLRILILKAKRSKKATARGSQSARAVRWSLTWLAAMEMRSGPS